MVFEEDELPGANSSRMFFASLIIHVFVIGSVWMLSVAKFKQEETNIPIDLVVVVNENLDGNEEEPPPVRNQVVPPPTPVQEDEQEKPAPEKEKTLKLPLIEDENAVVIKKEELDKKKEELEKKRKEHQEKRIRRIRDSLKKRNRDRVEKNVGNKNDRLKSIKDRLKPIKNRKVEIDLDAPSGDGKTDKKTLSNDDLLKKLAQGYRAGSVTQIASSEMQLCISLIEKAFYDRWIPPSWNDELKVMHLKIIFGQGGQVLSYRLENSSSDPQADSTVLRAASLMHRVPGLTQAFIDKTRREGGVVLRIKVKPKAQ